MTFSEQEKRVRTTKIELTLEAIENFVVAVTAPKDDSPDAPLMSNVYDEARAELRDAIAELLS